MLSRIAESLFWIGRYTERADGTARIVDVLRLQLLEDPGADEAIAARTVLSVIMGMPFEGDVGFADVSERARLRPVQRQLDHRRLVRRPRERPPRPRDPLDRALGGHQHHLAPLARLRPRHRHRAAPVRGCASGPPW